MGEVSDAQSIAQFELAYNEQPTIEKKAILCTRHWSIYAGLFELAANEQKRNQEYDKLEKTLSNLRETSLRKHFLELLAIDQEAQSLVDLGFQLLIGIDQTATQSLCGSVVNKVLFKPEYEYFRTEAEKNNEIYIDEQVLNRDEEALTKTFLQSLKENKIGDCKISVTGINICDTAQKIHSDMVRSLPQQISNDIIFTGIFVEDNLLTFVLTLTYDREFLEKSLTAAQSTMEKASSQMQVVSEKLICSAPVTQAFIGLGGVIHKQYIFNDGEFYESFEVAKC